MLLSVAGVSKQFGGDEVLSDVTFRLDRREKVALVGRNGCGKTTLLRILMGEEDADRGTVQLARGANIGFLRQEGQVDPTLTVREVAEQGRSTELAIAGRISALESLDAPTPSDLEELATLHEHWLEMEGFAAERDVETVLKRVGFAEADWGKPASALSGGEKTRLSLARLLLEEPDLLILDEPTNHLDLQAIEWLETWLQNYPGAVLSVSHDRTFLESTAGRILELRGGKVRSWPGPFSRFLELRAQDEERLALVAAQQQREIDKLDEYVRRFMNSQRTAQARGRLKMMEKLKAIQVHASKPDPGMKAGFQEGTRSGDVVWEANGLKMQFGERVLFKDFSWTIRAGERWGVVGENGAGKSTLIRVMLGSLEPTAGTVRHGSRVETAYFAQDLVDLNPERTPLEHLIWEFDMKPPEARTLLGRFLFSGDDVMRPIGTFSGGEKNKLVLASLTTLKPNLLVLDEPTNHLDMDSREALAAVLREFKGTLVLISHDRWLLSQVAQLTLDVRRDGISISHSPPGRATRGRPAPATTAAETKAAPKTARGMGKEINRLEKLLADLEAEIGRRESYLASLAEQLSHPKPGDDLHALAAQHTAHTQQLNERMEEWHRLGEQLDEFKASRPYK